MSPGIEIYLFDGVVLRYNNIFLKNMIKAAGCGDWIDEDIDLEPLGPEEIDLLVLNNLSD